MMLAVPITEAQEQILARGISQLPLADRDRAIAHVASVLRPLREVADSDVRHAVGAALQRYKQ